VSGRAGRGRRNQCNWENGLVAEGCGQGGGRSGVLFTLCSQPSALCHLQPSALTPNPLPSRPQFLWYTSVTDPLKFPLLLNVSVSTDPLTDAV